MKKKKLIMDKALELFAEKGFQATSVQDITNRSGISKGAFYLSFKSKDELIMNLIHEYLQEFTFNFDSLVSEGSPDRLLYQFYAYYFERFLQQSEFAKVFLKEQTHFLDEVFIEQVSEYYDSFKSSVLKMIEKVYGEEVAKKKYDLVYTILGLINSYMDVLLHTKLPYNAEQIADSLVEKTDILAKYMKLPVITKDLYMTLNEQQEKLMRKEKILELMRETIGSLEDSVEKESLQMLKEELINPTLNRAVIKGLLRNIAAHPECQRVSNLLHYYFEDIL